MTIGGVWRLTLELHFPSERVRGWTVPAHGLAETWELEDWSGYEELIQPGAAAEKKSLHCTLSMRLKVDHFGPWKRDLSARRPVAAQTLMLNGHCHRTDGKVVAQPQHETGKTDVPKNVREGPREADDGHE
jgi:hypothetical protein